MTTQEICSIIDVCAAKGVSILKFGPLHIEFGKTAPRTLYPVSEVALAPQLPVKEITENQHTKQTAAAVEAEEVRMMEDKLQQMFIENPVLAEQLLRDGELEDADDESEHDE